MNNYIVVGECNRLVPQVLLSIRSFSNKKCAVLGGEKTRSLRRSSMCSHYTEIRFDGTDDDRFADLVNTLADTMPHAVLIPVCCKAARMTNRVRQRLRVRITPIAKLSTLDMLDDKWLFYEFCVQHGLSVPSTVYVGSKADMDFDAIAAQLGLPFVLKPINEAGSQGVQVIEGKAHFVEAILHNDDYQFAPLIAQRYIAGIDAGIDLLAIHGRVRALAFQKKVGSEIRFFEHPELESLAYKLARASAYNGVMNIDVRLEDSTGKAYMLESNPRFWATLTAATGCGLNFVAESISPAPRSIPPRKLTAGVSHLRHPIALPSSWVHMLSDTGANGRLLRAKMYDLPTLGGYALSLSSKLGQQFAQLSLKRDRPVRDSRSVQS